MEKLDRPLTTNLQRPVARNSAIAPVTSASLVDLSGNPINTPDNATLQGNLLTFTPYALFGIKFTQT